MNSVNMILSHWNCYGSEYGWFWCFPFFFFFMFLLMVFLFRGWRRRSYYCAWPWWGYYNKGNKSDAINILKKRYAKGDISKEEFDGMIKDIG